MRVNALSNIIIAKAHFAAHTFLKVFKGQTRIFIFIKCPILKTMCLTTQNTKRATTKSNKVH